MWRGFTLKRVLALLEGYDFDRYYPELNSICSIKEKASLMKPWGVLNGEFGNPKKKKKPPRVFKGLLLI